MAQQLIMPQLGESIVEGTITRWLKREGEQVREYEPLLEVDTDKVTTEVPSPFSGTLLQILVPAGTLVQMGTLLAYIGAAGEMVADAAPDASPGAVRAEETVAAGMVAATDADESDAAPLVSPVAARMAAEHGVDIGQIVGTGKGGRVTKEDVLAAVDAAQAQPAAALLQGADAAQTRAKGAVSQLAPTAADRVQSGGSRFVYNDAPEPGTLISPVVSRLAAEYALDLTAIAGTGKGGRVTRRDVETYIAAHGAAPRSAGGRTDNGGRAGKADPAPAPYTEREAAAHDTDTARGAAAHDAGVVPTAGDTVIAVTGMRRAIADHMVRSAYTSPHVTTVMEADLSAVATHRAANRSAWAARGVNLTFTPYFVAAAAAALTRHALVNSSWGDDGIHLHRAIHIGVAVALDAGLIVPVIRSADQKSLLGLAADVNDLAARARANALKPDEVTGGTFTITNHGTGGSLLATPIINQPQCAILGVGKIEKRPKVVNDALAIRLMAYVSLTFDHRILDGATADAFLADVVTGLETFAG